MDSSNPISEKDKALFRQAMDLLDQSNRGGYDIKSHGAESVGTDKPSQAKEQDMIKHIQRGQLKPQAWLNIRGKTELDAQRVVMDFLANCMNDGLRCVGIVHGKGLRSEDGVPILKLALMDWLKDMDEVLGFCAANQAQGGEGALFIALTRS